ncbi:MAG: hypothetical protein K2M42_00755 [Oscillospiraceae bacterium]|nr:hypothetical protein [Oscillospiraceae bacterium]
MAEGKECYIRVRGTLVAVTPDVYHVCHQTNNAMKQANANIDFCGIRNLLHLLSGQGFTENELKKIADRIARSTGADIIFC